jgi:hypothetical protein
MATLTEILAILERTIAGADALYSKVGAAAVITAGMILARDDTTAPFDQTAGAHEKRLVWAAEVARHPRGASDDIFYAVVAANSSATQSQILNVNDTNLQNAINGLADGFAEAIYQARPVVTP